MSGRRSRTLLAPVAIVASMLGSVLLGETVPVPDPAPPASVKVELPVKPDSTRFAVIGDSGTGDQNQRDVGQRLAEARGQFPFTFAIMLGDNLYGSERPQDYVSKFEQPYKPLLDAKVDFYAALGNHDDPSQRLYKPFNMNGERYYKFTKGPVDFFVLDSNYLDPKQVDWLRRELEGSGSRWKIAYFHHPLYSSGGRHGSEADLRTILEPLFIEHRVNVVFAGHEHFYERIKPQKGIAYFTAGGSAKLRRGDIMKTEMTAAGYDRDRSFMLVEIADDTMYFQAISRTGQTVDSGTVQRREPERSSASRRAPDAGYTTAWAFPSPWLFVAPSS